jgi:hypothetical protein
MQKKLIYFSFIFLFTFVFKTFGQIDSAEITSSVPELDNFHEVIYVMWHDAYPNKNIPQIKSLIPDIKFHIEKINNAKLPGILREKEVKWREGLADLNKTADEYYIAANGNDDNLMLDAAEKLHMKFEMMIRILRPVLKEVDEYHKILYVIYHKYFPDKKYSDILSVMDALIEKAEAITKVPDDKLKKRLPDKISDFKTASKELYTATIEFKDILQKNNSVQINISMENMHSKYQSLEKIFD